VSTSDIVVLHRRYVDLASRFKSAWTFHQFLQGLQKFFAEVEIGRYPSDFQEIHGTLKTVADNLSGGNGEVISRNLDQVERQLGQMANILTAADARVSASLLRQFFDRVRNFDEQILVQMVRFYLLGLGESGLSAERKDKLDFLITKLSEEVDRVSSNYVMRDPTRLRELYQGFWSLLSGLTVDATTVAARRADVDRFRQELLAVASFEALTGSGFVQRYRELKHELGRYLLHPEILTVVVELNLAVKNKVRQYYRVEEERILDESHRILEDTGSDLNEPPLEAGLLELRQAVEQFERKQQRDNVKLDDLALLRRQVEELAPLVAAYRSKGDAADESVRAALDLPLAPGGETIAFPSSAPVARSGHFKEILEALQGSDDRETPRGVALSRGVYHLRLEPREIVAYRRLHVQTEGDPELEQFVLDAAALRLRINQEAAEISELLDESSVTREAPIFERARGTTRFADTIVQRFSSFIDAAVQESSFGEAQQLQLLRMRLIRDYSGLWLLVNRPAMA
jgi:predicted metal-dependent hydrolase